MRRSLLTCTLLASLSLAGCGPSGVPGTREGPVAESREAIAYGQADAAHTAVVALLADAGGGSFTECSGTVVQVQNGLAYVLTAAHCCNMGAPTIVVMSNDYTVGEQYLGGAAPQPPAYPVVAGSVYYHSSYNQQDYDFCMLTASGVPANTPTIALPPPGQDGLALGTQIEHVGFGVTDNNMNNSGRRHGTNTINVEVTVHHVSYTQGGAQHVPGPCEGDSGGPALAPAGAAQAQQVLVAITSYGNSASCSQGSEGTSMRVSSEMGPNGFVSNYLAGTPIGIQAGSGVVDCNGCAQSAQQSTCAAQTQACLNDPKCVALNNCLQGCQTQACADQCATTAGQAAVNKFNAVGTCICQTACVIECSAECGGSGSSSSSSSSSGAMNCGLQAADPACDMCLSGACCAESQACANDQNCINCVTAANPPAACSSVGTFTGLIQCVDGNCNGACGGGASSSSSSSSSSTSSSSGSTSSSGGTTSGSGSGGVGGGSGVGGGTGSGNGSGSGNSGATTGSGAGGGDVTIDSGCDIGGVGETSPSAFAGLLAGLALLVSRRRRAS